MALTAAMRNAMLSTFTGQAAYASLHSADPGTTGASEISGGSPAYARKAIAWNAPASGSVVSSAAVSFDVPASTTVAYYGFWTAQTGGTFLGGYPVTTSETYAGQGTFNLSSVTENIT